MSDTSPHFNTIALYRDLTAVAQDLCRIADNAPANSAIMARHKENLKQLAAEITCYAKRTKEAFAQARHVVGQVYQLSNISYDMGMDASERLELIQSVVAKTWLEEPYDD